jgi:hypothetical protein
VRGYRTVRGVLEKYSEGVRNSERGVLGGYSAMVQNSEMGYWNGTVRWYRIVGWGTGGTVRGYRTVRGVLD